MRSPGLIRYTICFIRSGERLLLLNRNKAPNMGLWNGLGGKLEPGEHPVDCILREVREEAGIALQGVHYAGLVTWGSRHDEVLGGMYAFLAEVESAWEGPRSSLEGLLDWKELSWVLHPQNRGVVGNIQRFLPVMMADPRPYQHHCIYRGEQLRVCIRHGLGADEALVPFPEQNA